jgi:hypothetical protein
VVELSLGSLPLPPLPFFDVGGMTGAASLVGFRALGFDV